MALDTSKVHPALVDATRLVYVEMLTDDQKATTVGLMTRAVGCFSAQGMNSRGVLTDNSSPFRSGEWLSSCTTLDLKPILTSPYTSRTNGNAERFSRTLLGVGAYGLAYQTSDERSRWLPRYLGIDNGRRCHMALGGLSPQQCLKRLLFAE